MNYVGRLIIKENWIGTNIPSVWIVVSVGRHGHNDRNLLTGEISTWGKGELEECFEGKHNSTKPLEENNLINILFGVENEI